MFGIPKYVSDAPSVANFQILWSIWYNILSEKTTRDIFVFPQSQEMPVQNSKLY